MTPHERELEPWLSRLTPQQWLRAALGELTRGEKALSQRDLGRAAASLKRAAGMALNAALVVRPASAWGRSYAQHLDALGRDESAPAEVRAAAVLLTGLAAAQGNVVSLITPSQKAAWLEAARTVMAHTYAIVYGSLGREQSP